MATAKKNVAQKETPFDELDNTEQRNRENGEIVGGQGAVHSEDPKRKRGETQQAYNERVPVALQPALETPKYSYLGKKL